MRSSHCEYVLSRRASPLLEAATAHSVRLGLRLPAVLVARSRSRPVSPSTVWSTQPPLVHGAGSHVIPVAGHVLGVRSVLRRRGVRNGGGQLALVGVRAHADVLARS